MARIIQNLEQLFGCMPGSVRPYPWQQQLSDMSEPSDRLIRIPTGMGKTLGVLSTWLLHRVLLNNREWPTRLVWCLPMRTLVEQTAAEAEKLLASIELGDTVGLHVLMGGVEERRWVDVPECPAILIGTQDMLLSRALNRGYAMYRAAWPRAFGLINTDALWVMDEVQLMGVGLTTSAQLQAFANAEFTSANRVAKRRNTWWMSATLQADWLQTHETQPFIHELRDGLLGVDEKDRSGPQWAARKAIELQALPMDAWADVVVNRHHSHSADAALGRQTLVVVNTVKSACALYKDVEKRLKSAGSQAQLILIHSRFRAAEREQWLADFLSRAALNSDTDRILIATQVVEAGVDISASCLVTELAPWPNLVQRFGRAARYGGEAQVTVLDRRPNNAKGALPYELSQLDAARRAVEQLTDVSIGELAVFEQSLDEQQLSELYPYSPLHVLLRHELHELFDTSADLSGADMDISRFVRDGDDSTEVQVFWRSWKGDKPPADLKPSRRELCAVPIGEAKGWVKRQDKNLLFAWVYLTGEWRAADADQLKPGMLLLAAPKVGGYSEKLGYTGAKPGQNKVVSEVSLDHDQTGIVIDSSTDDAQDSGDASSRLGVWKTIATHSRNAMQVVGNLCDELVLSGELRHLLELAMCLHDWGKAHPAFAQGTYLVHPMRSDLAKAPAWRTKNELYCTDACGPRKGFRHELASCLATIELLRGFNPEHDALLGRHFAALAACDMTAVLEQGDWRDNAIAKQLNVLDASDFDLLLYLIASHHGKVRASLQPSPKDQQFPINNTYSGSGYPVRGVSHGDWVPSVALPLAAGEQMMPEIELSLEPAMVGLSSRYGCSWSERIVGLLEGCGPFTLCYLEALIRTADARASDELRSPGADPDPLLVDVQLSSVVPEQCEHDDRLAGEAPA